MQAAVTLVIVNLYDIKILKIDLKLVALTMYRSHDELLLSSRC